MNSSGIGYLMMLFVLMLNAKYAFSQDEKQGRLTDISFTATWDGTEQRYIELLPASFVVGQSVDLIIGLHGHGSDRWQFATNERSECSAFRAFAAEHQMIAVSPDYRATTSWMGPAAEQDLLQIINELKSKYTIDRVFLVGGSMGGTSALTFAALHPELIDGVVAMNGHADHLEFNHFQDAIAESFGGTKNEIPMEYKKRSAVYWPERLSMPIAFTVGLGDTVVPPHSVIRLSKVLGILSKKTLLIIDEEGGHDTMFEDAMRAMMFIENNDKKAKIHE